MAVVSPRVRGHVGWPGGPPLGPQPLQLGQDGLDAGGGDGALFLVRGHDVVSGGAGSRAGPARTLSRNLKGKGGRAAPATRPPPSFPGPGPAPAAARSS